MRENGTLASIGRRKAILCSLLTMIVATSARELFKHGGEGLAEMTTWLMATSGASEASQIHVAIEVPHGPVVETLIERGFKVHAINPKQIDRFRDRFTLAGAKDDSRDGEVMSSALRTDAHCFRLFAVADPVVVERANGRLSPTISVPSATASQIAFASNCSDYFPTMLELEAVSHRRSFSVLWETVPTPHKAVRIHGTTIAKLLKSHRVRRFDAAQLFSVLRAPPVRVAAGTTEAASAHIATLISRIRLVNQQLKQAHQKLDVLTARLVPTEEAEPGQTKQHDVEILASLPGVGRIVLATLLAEASDALQQHPSAPPLRCGAAAFPQGEGQVARHCRHRRRQRLALPRQWLAISTPPLPLVMRRDLRIDIDPHRLGSVYSRIASKPISRP